MTPQPYSTTPQHPHQNILPNTYPTMPPHPFFVYPYLTSTPMYAPYVVPHYPNIPSLGYIHKPPSRLPSSMLPHLFPPEVSANPSKIMSKHRSNRRNRRPNEQNSKRRDAMRRREEENQDLVSVSVDVSHE